MAEHVRIAIVGTGFSGLGAAIRLRQAGFHDLVIFEREHRVGGTWRDNTYPGCACDVESHLYSFSFAPNPDWSRQFSPQPEILAYLERCARDYGVLPHVRFGHVVRSLRWDDVHRRWQIETSRGTFTADFVVAGAGGLSEPMAPRLTGLDGFAGHVFHSARWPEGVDLRGKRVGVVGTGASAVQIVPAIAPEVSSLSLFQRTPAWVIPRMDRAFSAREKALFREYPLLRDALRASIWARRELFVFGFRNPRVMQLVERFAVDYLERTVKDETLRARLRPSFRLGCKRILVTSDYLPALNRDNVHVFASAVERFEDGQLVTADGRRHSLDVLIFATGFQVTDMPMSHVVLGRDGRTLAEHWQGSPRAHLGTMVHSFPNLFLMTGPNTGLGHSSMVFMIESQLNLVEGALRHARAQPSCTIEPTRAAQQAWVDEVQRRTRGTVWINGGCASWYLDAAGNNATLWPGFTLGFRRRARFRKSEYAITRGSRE